MTEPYIIYDVRIFDATPSGHTAARQMRKLLEDADIFDRQEENTGKIILYSKPVVINSEWEDPEE